MRPEVYAADLLNGKHLQYTPTIPKFQGYSASAMGDSHTSKRYSDDELAEFKLIINKKLGRAQDDLTFYKDSLKEMAENTDTKVKGLDDGTSTAEMERLNALAARQQKLIKHLENALKRIESKTYGVCRETGTLIPKERLRAVPHATLSVEAKQARK